MRPRPTSPSVRVSSGATRCSHSCVAPRLARPAVGLDQLALHRQQHRDRVGRDLVGGVVGLVDDRDAGPRRPRRGRSRRARSRPARSPCTFGPSAAMCSAVRTLVVTISPSASAVSRASSSGVTAATARTLARPAAAAFSTSGPPKMFTAITKSSIRRPPRRCRGAARQDLVAASAPGTRTAPGSGGSGRACRRAARSARRGSESWLSWMPAATSERIPPMAGASLRRMTRPVLLHRRVDRVAVDRGHGAQVDDLDRDAVLGRGLGGLERRAQR